MTSEYWAVVRDDTGEVLLNAIERHSHAAQIIRDGMMRGNPNFAQTGKSYSVKRISIEVLED